MGITVSLMLWVIIQDEGSVHIVYVQKPENTDNVEDHHLGILESVCGRFMSTLNSFIDLKLAPPFEVLLEFESARQAPSISFDFLLGVY